MIVEALVIGGIGGLLGLALAHQGVALARQGMAVHRNCRYYVRFEIDWRVVGFCAAATLGASLLVAVMPALLATRRNLVDSLKQSGVAGHSAAPQHTRIRNVLVTAELALVLVLLCGAAVMARTFLLFAERPAGYDLEDLTLAQLPLSGSRFDGAGALRGTLTELADRVQTIAGARVALSNTQFIAGFGADARSIRIDGATTPAGASPRFGFSVTPNFFDVQGLRIESGRGFSPVDREGSEPVAIINRQMADLLQPVVNPLGARLRLRPDLPGDPWRVVVGIVGNYQDVAAPGRRVDPFVYLPLLQAPARPIDLLVRTSGDGTAAIAAVRAAMTAIDPDQPLTNVRSAVEEHRRGYWFVGYFAAFYATFALFALGLAVIGVYGVVAQTVGERTREFGIRAALGADRARLYRLVLGRSVALAVIGGAIGLAGSAFATRLLGWLLFGANPNDPRLLAAALVTLAVTVLLASYVPARRAARVDPVVVLRSDCGLAADAQAPHAQALALESSRAVQCVVGRVQRN